MPINHPIDVFISYQHDSFDLVGQIAEELEKEMLGDRHIICWYQARNTELGEFSELLNEVEESCRICLPVVTKKYSASAHCRREVSSIIDRIQTKPVPPVELIPFLVDVDIDEIDGALKHNFSGLTRVDALGRPLDEAVEEVVQRVINTLKQGAPDLPRFAAVTERSARMTLDFMRSQNAHRLVRNSLMDAALAHYREKYRSDGQCSEFSKGGFLVFRDGWVNCRDPRTGGLLKLRDVPIRITDTNEHEAVSRLTEAAHKNALLPTHMRNYAQMVNGFNMQDGKRTMSNGGNWVLTGVDTEGELPVLSIAKGHYLNFFSTCELLNFELAFRAGRECFDLGINLDDWVHGDPETTAFVDGHFTPEELPLRCGVCDDVFDMTNRVPGIGVDTLTVVKNLPDGSGRKANYCLIHQRSFKGVTEGVGNRHVIPAGSHEYYIDEHRSSEDDIIEKDFAYTCVREFGEELLGEDSWEHLRTPNLVPRHPLYQKLDPVFLGVGFEPLNTKTELLAAIVIDGVSDLWDIFQDNFRDIGVTNPHKITKAVFEKAVNSRTNDEGHSISLMEMNEDELEELIHADDTTASMNEIIRIVLLPENRAFFGVTGASAVGGSGQPVQKERREKKKKRFVFRIKKQ